MSETLDKTMDFSDLETGCKIKNFLEFKGVNHKPYYQYTTLPALRGMQKTRMLYLTRMDQLNDALECKNDSKRREKTYVASFSFGHAESMAMWSMYGTPYKQGIRLTIPLRAITEVLKNFKKNPIIYSVKTGEPIPSVGKAELTMMDVIYAHPGSLEHNKEKILNDKKGKIKKLTSSSELAFCIKNEVWLSEKETRLVLELENVLPDDMEKVAIDFGPAIDELEVTGSPCISETELKRALKGLDGKKIHQSFAYNQIYFKECKNCNRRTAFCRKNKKKTKK